MVCTYQAGQGGKQTAYERICPGSPASFHNMRLTQNSSLPSMTFDHWNEQGREISIVIVKGIFRREDEGWTRSDRQSKIGFTDEYDGDPAYAPLIREQDIAPGKPATDIVLRAVGFAPEGKPRPSWPVGVTIPGLLDYGFEVRGPSQRQKSFLGRWKPTDPGPVDQVSIDYRLAYGGTHRLPDGSMALHEFNPAGLGFVIGDLKYFDDPVPAPQIGAVADLASRDIRARLGVHGFGPIPRTWLPRRQFAGTYAAKCRPAPTLIVTSPETFSNSVSRVIPDASSSAMVRPS